MGGAGVRLPNPVFWLDYQSRKLDLLLGSSRGQNG